MIEFERIPLGIITLVALFPLATVTSGEMHESLKEGADCAGRIGSREDLPSHQILPAPSPFTSYFAAPNEPSTDNQM